MMNSPQPIIKPETYHLIGVAFGIHMLFTTLWTVVNFLGPVLIIIHVISKEKHLGRDGDGNALP